MRRYLLFILTSVSGFTNLYAQDYVYALNQFTPLVYHPSSVAIDNEASISFLNRKTQVGPGINYQNNAFNAEYPMIDSKSGRRLGGLGLHFLQKDAGNSDLLESVTIGLTAAYNLHVATDQFVSFGIQSNYNSTRTSLESLTSGSQWLAAEFRFDPSAPLGEPIAENRISYFSMNAGAMWYLVDKSTHAQRAFAGVSAFNMNRPDQSFFESGSRIPVGYLINAGGILYHNQRFHLTPQVLYQYDNHSHAVNFLVSNKLFFNNENPYDIIKSGSIELLGKYDFKRDLALGIVFHQPSVSFGFNYNLPLASQSKDRYFRNAFEFGVRLTKLIWKPEPKKVTITSTSGHARRNFDFGNQSSSNQGAAAVSDTDVIQKSIEDYSKVSAVQFELEKDFKFAFGKTELNAEAKAFLDDLLKLMEKNPEYNLEVIGHTDNVGKHVVNYRLSSARAQAVADYLLTMGLKEGRVHAKGMGDTQPLAPNDTEENRSKNRRVQFIIYVNR